MKNYSFLDTILLVNGIEISGFDEGDDVINMARATDSTIHKIGADGEMTVAITADRSGSATFRLMQSSESNKYLSGLINAQENGLFIPIFAQFKDLKGLDLVSGTQGYITKPADLVRGSNAQPQEWVIMLENLIMLHGGN